MNLITQGLINKAGKGKRKSVKQAMTHNKKTYKIKQEETKLKPKTRTRKEKQENCWKVTECYIVVSVLDFLFAWC